MKPRNKTIRVFLSSTFEDLKMERDALQQKAFHNLREYCRDQGWQFQAVDLRWGITEEATIDQRTMEICLREIARCQEQSPRPNFIILLGERYGWRPLPDKILQSVASDLTKEMPFGIQSLFKQWYELDENQLPESIWRLRAREGRYIDYNEFNKAIQKPLIEFFTKWAGANLPDPDQPEHSTNPLAQQRLSMERSATEQEIHAGAFRVEDAKEHVFAFFRNLPGCPENNAIYHDADQQPVQRLRQHVKSFLPKNNISEFPAGWDEINDRPDVTHLEQLSNDVENYLKTIIDKEIERYQLSDELEMEQAAHEAFARERTFGFSGRDNDIKAISDYVLQDHKAPFVVWGESGTGKSSLLAMAMDQVRNKIPHAHVIARFIGVTGKSSNGHTLLYDICSRLCLLYGGDQSGIPHEPAKLQIAFKEYLSKATAEHPLILSLDALDQLNENDTARQLSWLPYKLPPHVRVVFSTLKVDCFDILQERENPHPLFYEITPLTADDGRTALGAWLLRANRTLQPHQKHQIIKDFEYAGCAPLYLHLAFTQAQHWESFRSKERLGRDILEMIEDLYRKLSDPKSHGPIVKEVLTAIRCAKQGLSDDEILGILSADDDFFNLFGAQTYHTFSTGENTEAGKRRIPPVLWIRLYHDLEYYLTRRNAPGGEVITFYHRQLVEAVDSVYLKGTGVRQKRHWELSQFFAGKRSLIKETPPLIANIRKCDELPFQLIKSEDWDAVIETLCDLDFIQAKAAAKMTYELVNDYNAVLLTIPDNQQYIREEKDREARLNKYAKDLVLYAKGKIKQLDVPLSIMPWTEEKIDSEIARIKSKPTRLDRLNSFYQFLGLEVGNLQTYCNEMPHFSTQQAWNNYNSGPVGVEADKTPKEDLTKLMLRTITTRPPWSPLPLVLKTFSGHTNGVEFVAITPDGKQAISASRDNTCMLWDLQKGNPLKILSGHTQYVTSVDITPDGKQAISASRDNTCILWDLQKGVPLKILSGHTHNVTSVAITPDGKQAISASWDTTCIIWDLMKGKPLQILYDHTGHVESVAITPDGKQAISASWDRTCIIWDLMKGKPLKTLLGHTSVVSSVAITPDGKQVISASWDKTCILWDLKKGKPLKTLSGHTSEVSSVAITPDGKMAVSVSWDHTCILWNLENGKPLKIRSSHSRISSVAITPDGKQAVFASLDKTVTLWDIQCGYSPKTFSGHNRLVTFVSITPDGKHALSASVDATCIIWDLKRGIPLKTLFGHTNSIWSLAITRDGKQAVSASNDKNCILWDLKRWIPLKILSGHTRPVDSVAIAPDGKQAVSASTDNNCILWDLKTGKALKTLSGHTNSVRSVAITSDGKQAVSASTDNTCIIWDLQSGKPLKTLYGHTNHVASVAITPDGKQAISASWDKTCILWDLKKGKPLKTLFGHTSIVNLVAITSDGKQAVSASMDNTCIIWDLQSGKPLKTLYSHTSFVTSVHITPDGKHAVTTSDDKTCILWDLLSGDRSAQFVANQILISCSLHNTNIVLGESSGEVLFLKIPDFYSSKEHKIATIRIIWNAVASVFQNPTTDCPACGLQFEPPQNVIETIARITKKEGLKPEQSSCLELPDEVWEDPGLLGECPKCGDGLKFNPFIVGGED